MTFVQASTGGGGWPMSVFLTPDLKPVFGGTYFPPTDSTFGRPGFKTILKNIMSHWAKDPEGIVNSGNKIVETIARSEITARGKVETSEKIEATCFSQLLKRYDAEFGGFSQQPKFPQPVNMNFLFSLAARHPDSDRGKQALSMCLNTLKSMALGGIHDHVSKGFARYSTDSKWHVPHFEKMLYDQGQLAVSYAQAFRATHDRFYEAVVRDILTYINRDLRHPLGGYFSAEDADSLPSSDASKKVEGAFCVWTYDELKQHLSANLKDSNRTLFDLVRKVYNVRENGNVDPRGDPHGELKGKNVLTRLETNDDEVRKMFYLSSETDLEKHLEDTHRILHEVRGARPRPGLDNKILTAWNGLAISGLCEAGDSVGDQTYIQDAVKAAEFIQKHLYDEERGVLLRSVYTDPSDAEKVTQISNPIDGFLDDYAFLIRGLIALYQSTFDQKWLAFAVTLQEKQIELFWDNDAESGGFYTSADGDKSIVLRMKDDQDGAEPASNSVAVHNLIMLGQLLDRKDFSEKAVRIVEVFSERINKIPMALPEMVSACILLDRSPMQIILAGDPSCDPELKSMIEVIRTSLLPPKVLMLADRNEGSILYQNNGILKTIPETTGVYICENNTCSLPITSTADLRKKLSIN